MHHEAGGTLTVCAGGRNFRLPLRQIAEILRLPPMTMVPLGPPGLVGVANLRSQILPVVCLAALAGVAGAAATAASRIVVIDTAPATGLLVDAVLAFDVAHDATALDAVALLASHFTATPDPTASRTPYRASATPAPGLSVPGTSVPGTSVPASLVPADPDLVLVGLHLAGQDFAIPLADVVEIMPLPTGFIPVPGTDPAMLGIVDSRVGLLPLLSLRVLLGLAPDGYDLAKVRIVITHVGGRLAGLVADTATDILPVPADCIEPVPPILSRGQPEARIAGICRLDGGRRLVSLLSVGSLLDPATTARLLAIAPEASAPRPQAAIAGEQFVVARLGDIEYGIPVVAVDEVVRHPGVLARIPSTPGFVAGAMNLRGKPIPVIDQAQVFGIPEPGQPRRIIILRSGDRQAGFAVDAASELLTVTGAELRPAPALTIGRTQVFDRIATLNRDGRMILLMNPDMMLGEVERGIIEAPV